MAARSSPQNPQLAWWWYYAVERPRAAALSLLLLLWAAWDNLLAWVRCKDAQETPEIAYVRTPLNRLVVQKCPRLHQFRPSPWCRGSIAQTLCAAALASRSGQRPLYHRELLRMADFVDVALDWSVHPTYGPLTPTVLVLHGVCGSSREPYVEQFVNACVRLGWRVVVYNRRGHGGLSLVPQDCPRGMAGPPGCGLQPLSLGGEVLCAADDCLASTCPPAADTVATDEAPQRRGGEMADSGGRPYRYWPKYACLEDMERVVAHVREAVADAPLLAVGFSAGSNLLAKYIGSKGSRCPIDAGVSVCNAYDLVEATRTFVQTRPVTDAVMTQMCKHMYVEHLTHFHRVADARDLEATCPLATHRVLRSRSVRDFDREAACPLHSQSELDDFYADQHCVTCLDAVSVPMLLLNSRDDPVIDGSLADVGLAAARSNENLISVVTAHGGHLGWVERLDVQGDNWMISSVTQYLQAILSLSSRRPGEAPHRSDGRAEALMASAWTEAGQALQPHHVADSHERATNNTRNGALGLRFNAASSMSDRLVSPHQTPASPQRGVVGQGRVSRAADLRVDGGLSTAAHQGSAAIDAAKVDPSECLSPGPGVQNASALDDASCGQEAVGHAPRKRAAMRDDVAAARKRVAP